MGFLSRLETFYLNVLRVLILVAATLALIVVVVGVALGVPKLSATLGLSHPAIETSGSTLGDFVAERNAQGQPVGAEDQTQSQAATVSTPDNIRSAVSKLQTYLKRSGLQADTDKLTAVLVETRGAMPTDYQDRYGDSLNSLADQLNRSTGRPLSGENVSALMEWHAEKFKAQIAAIQAKQAADTAAGLQSLVVAGSALAIFLLIVFCFLVVKIERNLRLVRTVALDGSSGAGTAPRVG